MVDAVYSIALRRYRGWAFAISSDAELRLVRIRDEDELDSEQAAGLRNTLPTSMQELSEFLSKAAAWEETDLTKCEGASAHLLQFPAQRGEAFWSEKELQWAPGFVPKPESDTIIVTADGDGITVRARSVEDVGSPKRLLSSGFVFYDQNNGGEAYDWAIKMEEIVRPCLKPSESTPPWEKVLAANLSAQPLVPE